MPRNSLKNRVDATLVVYKLNAYAYDKINIEIWIYK